MNDDIIFLSFFAVDLFVMLFFSSISLMYLCLDGRSMDVCVYVDTIHGNIAYLPLLLNGGTMVAIAEWHGRFCAYCHRQFVMGDLPKAPWHVYMAEFWPSTICH